MENCIIYDENVCGQYKPHKQIEEMISFEELATVNESFLIKSWIGVAVKDSDVICPFHRAKFGKKWRSSRLCCYPNHHGKSNFGLRALILQEYHPLCEKFPKQTFPFGSQICAKHRKQLSNQTTSPSIESNPPEIHDE